jgi:hypothetical protein
MAFYSSKAVSGSSIASAKGVNRMLFKSGQLRKVDTQGIADERKPSINATTFTLYHARNRNEIGRHVKS